jgi:hypothetical protein
MTSTHRSHLAAFLFGAILAVEITGLALRNPAVVLGAMLTGALLGAAATAYVIYGSRRYLTTLAAREQENE